MSKQNEPTLLGIAQRILKLENEKAEIAEIIKEVYSEAKNAGYNDKVLKRAIKWISLEEKDQKKILAENDMFDLYVSQMDLPL
jgi:uncharacterized protein (UPF0335 family)